MRRASRALAFLAGAAAAYAAASWAAARSLSHRLVSSVGLAPPPDGRQALISALAEAGAKPVDFRHVGCARSPIELAGVFASPGDPASRPTILFLHGKGGEGSEWTPDALRAVALGYNVLVPELRGHPPSGGEFLTFGLLEKEDLACLVEAAEARFGIDPSRLGVHSCSAGSTIALEFAAGRDSVRALWLESPYADPAGMAKHYLALATGLPEWLLGLTARWAMELAVARIGRALSLDPAESEEYRVDPLRAAGRVRGRVCLVYGQTDELVPPRFARALVPALPPGSIVWAARAGHCHHDDEPQKMLKEEYLRRWTAFFGENLPVKQKDEDVRGRM